MELIKPQICPQCKTPFMKPNADYPYKICPTCVKKRTMKDVAIYDTQ